MSSKLWIGLLAGLLFAALIAILVLYEFASRPLYHEADEPLIERTRQGQAAMFHKGRETLARETFPIVLHLSGRTCVELRPKRQDPSGTYLACYDRRTGEVVEERASVS